MQLRPGVVHYQLPADRNRYDLTEVVLEGARHVECIREMLHGNPNRAVALGDVDVLSRKRQMRAVPGAGDSHSESAAGRAQSGAARAKNAGNPREGYEPVPTNVAI